MGTLEPFMEALHVFKKEISTTVSLASMTENFVPWILQHSINH